jgi:TIR domain
MREAQMKVFISWSGDRSRQLAEVIQWWLQHVLQFTKPFFSPEDIGKGRRWNNEISKELGQSQIGIIAMTEDNLTSPWIMFEAGAISKVVDESLVCPIVFGIKTTDLVGPLKDRQAIAFKKDEVRQLLITINKAAKEVALTERTLDEQFDKWWPDLEQKVEAIMSTQPQTKPQRTERDLLEEVVSNTRTILRELQGPRLIFAPNREVEAFARALLQPQPTIPARGMLYPDAPSPDTTQERK